MRWKFGGNALKIWFVGSIWCLLVFFGLSSADDSDIGLNMVQLVTKYGYPLETHKNIETSDGYLLTMHRIPNGNRRRTSNAGNAIKIIKSNIGVNQKFTKPNQGIFRTEAEPRKAPENTRNQSLDQDQAQIGQIEQFFRNYTLRVSKTAEYVTENGKGGPETSRKPVVFLMHGLLGSSFDYVSSGPKRSLSFLLADLGYDIWMGNGRGNMYSRKHKTLDPDVDRKFWEFSWHEIGVTDMPAMVDYILNCTGEKQMTYIGLSQGTTVSYVFLAERPEYNHKIKHIVSLAPVAYMGHMRNRMLKGILKYLGELQKLANLLRVYEFLPKPLNALVAFMARNFCHQKGTLQDICAFILYLIGGYDPSQLNKTVIPVILGNSPAGASVRQLFHYGQIIISGSFEQYDHGKSKNLLRYNSETPPKYNLTNIVTPVALFFAESDWFANEEDIQRLATEVRNVSLMYKVPLKTFSHVDFYWANDVVKLVYKRIFQLMNDIYYNEPIK